MHDKETHPFPSYFSSGHVHNSKSLLPRLKNGLSSRNKQSKKVPGLWATVFLLFLILAFCGVYGLFFAKTTHQSAAVISNVARVPSEAGTASPTQKTQPPALSGVMTRIPTPTVAPVQPTPAGSAVQGINNNPWGYNFTPGRLIYSPPAQFCSYFNCVENFWNGHGYVVECNDDKFSYSGGTQYACTLYDGVKRTLYAH